MKHEVYLRTAEVERAAAQRIVEVVRSTWEASERCNVALSADESWEGVWKAIIELHRETPLPLDHLHLFALAEYVPIAPQDLQSHSGRLRRDVAAPLGIPDEQLHLLDGSLPAEEIPKQCRDHEAQIAARGGIDLALPDVSPKGHLEFNGPGSAANSVTRLASIERLRRVSLAADFYGTDNVPSRAITAGVATILAAKAILTIQLGEGRAPLVAQLLEGSPDPAATATQLQNHPAVVLLTDRAAAGELVRYKTPWLSGPVTWTEQMTRRAVKMLALSTGKAILKLTEEEYNDAGLQDLLEVGGSAYDINISVFRRFQSTITGWPGGKPAEADQVFPKRVIVFSPHPDDDVISMGGTLIRLADQGHTVHIAYQTSGNIAVFDEDALRYIDFVRDFCTEFQVRSDEVAEIDSEAVLRIKGLIRRNEARAAARCCGVPEERLHFQDLPFYQSGTIRKRPIGEEDISRTEELLREVQPHQIYAAGDLSDPHGTHRTCLSILLQAVQRCADTPWWSQCTVWLYRGAWQEWPIDEIDMAVPLSPQEVERKRVAIFKHESQKDRALFPGSDSREFWQRSEARNAETARLYDQLGLAEYEAIEGFARWDGESGLLL